MSQVQIHLLTNHITLKRKNWDSFSIKLQILAESLFTCTKTQTLNWPLPAAFSGKHYKSVYSIIFFNNTFIDYVFTLTMSSGLLLLFISPALTHYSQLGPGARQVLNGGFISWLIGTVIVCQESDWAHQFSQILLGKWLHVDWSEGLVKAPQHVSFSKVVNLLISVLNALLSPDKCSCQYHIQTINQRGALAANTYVSMIPCVKLQGYNQPAVRRIGLVSQQQKKTASNAVYS